MKRPLGKTYLILMDFDSKQNELSKGIYLPQNSKEEISPYIGDIVAIGTGFKDQQPLLSVGTKVICDYNVKDLNRTRLLFGQQIYCIYCEKDILGVIE